MNGIIGLIVAIVVCLFVFWLLDIILPVWIAAVLTLLLFLALITNSGLTRRGAV